MDKYKSADKYASGDKVISRYKSRGCAPEGSRCEVRNVVDHGSKGVALYDVVALDGKEYRNYEDELEPAEKCPYCQEGKKFNSIYFGDTRIESYILGNRLNTDVSDAGYPDEEDGTSERITHCPFCGDEVHEEPDEDIEEVLE